MKIPRLVAVSLLLAPAAIAAEASKRPKVASATEEHGSVAQASSLNVKIAETSSSSAPMSVSVSAQSAPFGQPPMNVAEHRELDLIQTNNQIEVQKTQKRLRALTEEKDEVVLRYNLGAEKLKLELWPTETLYKRAQLDAQLREEKKKADQASYAEERDRLRLQNEIAREKLSADQIKADEAKLRLETAMRELDYQSRKLKVEAEIAEQKTLALKRDLELRDKREVWLKQANRDPEYPAQPFKDGVLTVSDRRITMDGPIISGVADYVTERIHYFNNKSESLPIFIVINRSPGGSVMEGYRIVKAIRASKAPVHVVVKSYAASMAAVITTLAPHSYAYPNAVVLHHQLLAGGWGNVTQIKERLEEMQEWYRRLAEPVAKKMGLSTEEFTKRMYKQNSDGDWREFADRAVELKWVDTLVHEVRETGIVKEPEAKPAAPAFAFFGLKEEADAEGHKFVRLPRLEAPDAYWIHNPDKYYR